MVRTLFDEHKCRSFFLFFSDNSTSLHHWCVAPFHYQPHQWFLVHCGGCHCMSRCKVKKHYDYSWNEACVYQSREISYKTQHLQNNYCVLHKLTSQYLPVLFPTSHALLIHWSIQLTLVWKDDFVVDNDGLDDFINMCLARHRILAVWYGHQGWTKADG